MASTPNNSQGSMPFTKDAKGSAINKVVFNKSAAIMIMDVFIIRLVYVMQVILIMYLKGHGIP